MRDSRKPVYKEVDTNWVHEIIINKLGDNQIGSILLDSYIEEVGTSICNYINRGYVPEPLKFVYVNLVMDLLKSEAINGNIENEKLSQIGMGSLSAIVDGDSELKFATSSNNKTGSHVADVDSFLYNYTQQLDKYRLLKW